MSKLSRIDTVLRNIVVGLALLWLPACDKPTFIKRMTAPVPPPVAARAMLQVTPRELLSARLVNPPVDDNAPRITVGKLLEYADRYLSCDCSGLRFVKSWERLGDSYRLITNSDIVRPLNFACRRDGEKMNCYLSEIDRGPHIQDLEERFVPGSEFIQFMYENGLQCAREGPCPAQIPPA